LLWLCTSEQRQKPARAIETQMPKGGFGIFWYTIWLFNIAMENHHF
jgi:hypothetical protein